MNPFFIIQFFLRGTCTAQGKLFFYLNSVILPQPQILMCRLCCVYTENFLKNSYFKVKTVEPTFSRPHN